MLHFALHSTASEWCCTQNSSKNNPNQPSSAFVFGVLRCLGRLFRLFHVVSPQLHVALGVNPTPNSEARDEHQSIPNYKAPASCERMIPVSGREPRGWDHHPMGESDQWFEPKKLSGLVCSDDFPDFKEVIRWKIPS